MRFLSFDRLDRYAVRLFAVPLLTALATMLLATMLQRLLRLFDIAASTGASIASVLFLAADLVPHYLGLALPVAFTAAIFMAAARMGDDSELDAMLATGRSIARIATPYFVLALLLSVFNLYLFGRLQPLARYDYHVKMDAVLQTNWDAKIEENRFIDIAHGFSFSADRVEDSGRRFTGVFMERRQGGIEEITTAVRGQLESNPDTRKLRLKLEDGMRVRQTGDGAISTTRFVDGFVEDFSPTRAPYRDRGESASERTLPELWQAMCTACDPASAAEFHSRLARALLPPLLPLLALPLGMASKRGRRTPGVVFASLALLLLNHTLQFGKSLAESGRLPAALAVWTPFLLFALLSLWIFRGSLAWPGDNPVSRTVGVLERLIERFKPRRLNNLAKAAP
ncbi:LptF/LptG family permease [Variovorax sp. N23]|uniref:LptF/LptG family permease n=1 Tax=Variovorax sp. N23 TaxID=2980555 RepID=UPI0021C74EA5|nr:LptF/LptG family permease [Variovorax sp. N23]MCU4120782.1 LptF/LptG family permease [Variovorax sp. N23]